MKTVDNIMNKKMISLLKSQIGKKLISFKYDYSFNEGNTANSAGIEFNFENQTFIMFSELKFFNILDGEDYSYIAICDENDFEYTNLKESPKREDVAVNQIIHDIQIVKDVYHFTNSSKELDETFICDYAIIFVLEKEKICFEKFDIYENELEISKVSIPDDVQLFDNSEDFDNPELYDTERKRIVKSLKDIDYTDHGNPKAHKVPHEHDWDWSDPDNPKRSKTDD